VSIEKFITSLPFIAIRSDLAGGPLEKTEGEYVINPLPVAITDVTVRIGGFFSDDDGVVEANPKVYALETVNAYSAERFTFSTSDEYDEFVCWWELKYTIAGQEYSAEFSTGESLSDAKVVRNFELLGGIVHVPPREKSDDLELIDPNRKGPRTLWNR
jgi:hypothetical protein